MKSHSRLFRIGGATLLAAAAIAQTGENLVMKSSVREVLLDVVVRDKHGKPVKDLKPEQLTVYENGVKQNVRSFRLVTGGEVRAEDEKEAAEAVSTTAAPPVAGKSSPRLNPLRTVNLVCLVFSDLNAETRALALEAGRQFVNNELRPNTYIGVFGTDDAGLRLLSGFSNDRPHLLKAVAQAAMNQLRPSAGSTAAGANAAVTGTTLMSSFQPAIDLDMSRLATTLMNSAGEVMSGAAASEYDPSNPIGPHGSLELDQMSGMRDVDALRKLVGQLSPLPYQKTVVLLSAGITRPADNMGYWQSLIRAANTGGVTFYGVDVYGLNVCQDDQSVGCLTAHSELQQGVDVLNKTVGMSTGNSPEGILPGELSTLANSSRQGASNASPQESMELMKQDDYVHNAVLSANKQAALRDLAENTGGFLIANTNNTAALMKHVMEDVDTHYEVTYQPSTAGYDGKFRKVEVKLARADWQPRTRSGYFALPESDAGHLGAGELTGLKALDSSARPHAFDYKAEALRFASGDGASQYAVVFNVPITSLTGTPEAATNSHRYHVALLAVARDSNGQVQDWFSRDVPSRVGDKYLPSLKDRQMIWEHSFHLAPGRYTIETAVVDEEANRTSAEALQVTSAPSSAPDLSDIMLAQEVKDLERTQDQEDPFEADGRRVLPLASSAVPAGTNPFLYFVLYPGRQNAEKTRLHVEFFRDGKEIARRSVEVGPPDANGTVPMLISAVQKKPGNYQVRVAISEGGVSVARSLSYSIAGN
jgi:VWFA-related protein